VRLEFRHYDEAIAQQTARALAQRLSKLLTTDNFKLITVIGPVPCFFLKQAGQYRWQIILRGPNPKELLHGLKLDGWRVEVEPVSLL
jgi:primosomal protein N' (replication factor Y)